MAMSRLPLGEMDQHEAAAADVAGARIGHRHGEADGDRGIDRVAAALEHFGADQRRAALLRHHHAVLGGDRLDRRILLRPLRLCRCDEAASLPAGRQRTARRVVRIMRVSLPATLVEERLHGAEQASRFFSSIMWCVPSASMTSRLPGEFTSSGKIACAI